MNDEYRDIYSHIFFKKISLDPFFLFGDLRLSWFKNFSVVQINVIEDNKRLKYDSKSVAQTFAKFYSTLAESLLKNLPNSHKFSQI